MEDGKIGAIVASFMEVTSCDSQSLAARHLAFSNWRLDAAINRYFTVGAADPTPAPPVVDPIPVRSETFHGDTVRDPIPARSDTLYPYEDFYGPSSAAARAAPSIWSANREPPSRTPVYPVPVVVEDASMPNATGWESDGDTSSSDEKDETSIAEEDKRAKEDYMKNDDKEKEAMEEDDGTRSVEMEDEDDEYDGTEADYEYSDNDQDDGDYLDAAETDRMEALEGQPPPRARTEKTLDDLFRPPHEIMFQGSFHDAKVHGARTDKWLLVNVQLSGVFASHLHNRDLWSNEVVVQVIKDNFVFQLLQKTEGRPGDEAGKVCCFYKLEDDQLPAVLLLDPITGQLLAKWCGVVQHPDDFLTSIGKYTESKPSMVSKPRIARPIALATPQEPVAALAPLPKVDKIEAPAPSPKDDKIEAPDYGLPMEGEEVCKLRVRFYTGSTITRDFGSTRPVAVLFAYCRSVVRDQAGTEQPFRIKRMAGGAFEELRDDGASFEELKLNRDTVMVVLND